MTASSTEIRINVLTQNVLHDVTRSKDGLIASQDNRVAAIADNLQAFPGSLDVVGAQEAHKSPNQHNGEALAQKCGFNPGAWLQHNEKPHPHSSTGRSNEYIGLFGAMVDLGNVCKLELGDNRRALLTTIAGVALVTLHLRAGGYKAWPLRRAQAQALGEQLEQYEDVVLFGDFNEPPIKLVAPGRSVFEKQGYQSVFSLLGESHPKTFPVGRYADVYGMRSRWSLDDIMIRGSRVQTLAAGVISQVAGDATDHNGIWATLNITPPLHD